MVASELFDDGVLDIREDRGLGGAVDRRRSRPRSPDGRPSSTTRERRLDCRAPRGAGAGRRRPAVRAAGRRTRACSKPGSPVTPTPRRCRGRARRAGPGTAGRRPRPYRADHEGRAMSGRYRLRSTPTQVDRLLGVEATPAAECSITDVTPESARVKRPHTAELVVAESALPQVNGFPDTHDAGSSTERPLDQARCGFFPGHRCTRPGAGQARRHPWRSRCPVPHQRRAATRWPSRAPLQVPPARPHGRSVRGHAAVTHRRAARPRCARRRARPRRSAWRTTWWPSTCSPRSGSRGSRLGMTRRTSVMVWTTATDHHVCPRDLGLKLSGRAGTSARRAGGGRAVPYWTKTTCLVSVGGTSPPSRRVVGTDGVADRREDAAADSSGPTRMATGYRCCCSSHWTQNRRELSGRQSRPVRVRESIRS